MLRLIVFAAGLVMTTLAEAEDFRWNLRSQHPVEGKPGVFERRIRSESWPADRTAFIVCDVWDKHHCLNAVRRLEEFGPRLNQVLTTARDAGAVIIHSPSDCMPAYEQHPSRLRAINAPKAATAPPGVEFWCSRIPAEELADYPIDQSDGGEDDDPAEHARWAAELKALGRNPAMPWKSQNAMIDIDPRQDYLSDRGDEVWNILEQRGITHVVLTGVHVNMCVLGRPFGLRQMVRGGRQVVLMRDMTDSMYNPARWPFVDHYTGNDLVISHIERFVCPTVTSDQILGGQPFQFSGDHRAQRDAMDVTSSAPDSAALASFWVTATLPGTWEQLTDGGVTEHNGAAWYRCTVRPTSEFVQGRSAVLRVPVEEHADLQIWLNGQELKGGDSQASDSTVMEYRIPEAAMTVDDANLLVVRRFTTKSEPALMQPPELVCGESVLALAGRWQLRTDDNPGYRNMPLPAKFGTSTDIVFER